MRAIRIFPWSALVAASLALIAQPTRATIVSGCSMSPTYASGELLLTKPVDRALRRGDVVVVDGPDGPLLKRVALLPGDRRMQWRYGSQWIDMTDLNVPFSSVGKGRTREVRVPPGTVFLLGDEIDLSIDSRSFGPVAIGKVRRLVLDQRAPSALSGVAGRFPQRWLAQGRSANRTL